MTDPEEATKPVEDDETRSDVVYHTTTGEIDWDTVKASRTRSMRSPGAVYGAAPSLGPFTSPITTTAGTIRFGPLKAKKSVVLPTRMTPKVLVAFLDEDDDTVWAKKLKPVDISIDYDSEGNATMSFELSLDDVYKNESPE